MQVKPFLRKAQYYETDQMAIIHHANYVHWMEEARLDFLEQAGYSYEKAVEAGMDFVLMGISCTYRSMVRFGDTVSIEIKISQLHPAMMTIAYIMTDAKTGALRCEAESRHCCYDRNLKRPVAMNRALPEIYAILTEYHAACTAGEEKG